MFPLIWLTGYTCAVELRAFVAVPRITLKCDHLPLCTLDSSGSHLIFLTDWCAQIKRKEIEAYGRTYFTSPAERCLSTSNTYILYNTSLFLELHCSVYFARAINWRTAEQPYGHDFSIHLHLYFPWSDLINCQDYFFSRTYIYSDVDCCVACLVWQL